jgi:hypothetical protein
LQGGGRGRAVHRRALLGGGARARLGQRARLGRAGGLGLGLDPGDALVNRLHFRLGPLRFDPVGRRHGQAVDLRRLAQGRLRARRIGRKSHGK